MDEHLKPPGADGDTAGFQEISTEHDDLRILSRSPHPYHQQAHEILEPSDSILRSPSSVPIRQDNANNQLLPFPTFSKDSTPITESGTEADDETYVKRLPPSKAKSHKGLRGRNELPSGAATPPLTPVIDVDLNGLAVLERTRAKDEYKRRRSDRRRRNRELGRRGAEVAILGSLAWLVSRNPTVKPVAALWRDGESRILTLNLGGLG